jgi:hypothetical protein
VLSMQSETMMCNVMKMKLSMYSVLMMCNMLYDSVDDSSWNV